MCEDPTSFLRQRLGHKTYQTCMASIGCWDYIDWSRTENLLNLDLRIVSCNELAY